MLIHPVGNHLWNLYNSNYRYLRLQCQTYYTDHIINHGSDVRLAYNFKKIYAENFNFIKQLNIIKYKLNDKNNVLK